MVMIQPAVESFYNLVCGIFINLENSVAGEEEGTGGNWELQPFSRRGFYMNRETPAQASQAFRGKI